MKLVTIIIIALSLGSVSAQTVDSIVEVRLTLIQQSEGRSAKGLSVCMSVINHSNKDIYIPGFESLRLYCYVQTEMGWKELNIYTHEFYKPHVSPSPKDKSILYQNDPPFLTERHEITEYFNDTVSKVRKHQRELLNIGYSLNPRQINIWVIIGYPIFLKANEHLDFYSIYPLEFLLEKHRQYRISFNSELRDERYLNPEYANKYVALKDSVLGYKLYFPKKIISNNIYYSTMDMNLNK